MQHAIAILLLEDARADLYISGEERDAVQRLLMAEYDIAPERAGALLDAAGERVEDVTALHPFLRQVNDHFDAAERQRLIEVMWRIAWIDEEKHRYEEALIRRVADLIYVSHSDFIRAKINAERQVQDERAAARSVDFARLDPAE